jgi:hypothetical protein
MGNLTQEQLAALIANVVSQVMQGQSAAPKAPAISSPVDRLAQKDRSLVAGLRRKGIKEADIKLMNRADPKAEFNVRPFKGWLELGRQVRKGERGIRGLFHISQTDVIKASPAKAQPVVPAEQQQLFAKAKAAFKAKKAKAQSQPAA